MTFYKQALLTEEPQECVARQETSKEVGESIQTVLWKMGAHLKHNEARSLGHVSKGTLAARLALSDNITASLSGMVKYWQQFGMFSTGDVSKITEIIVRNTVMEYQDDYDRETYHNDQDD